MKPMKRLFISLLMVLCFLLPGTAQSVQQMKKDRQKIENKIAESKKLLATTDKDVKSQLSTLSVLSERIKQQTELVSQLGNEVAAMNEEMRALERQQAALEADLKQRKASYSKALQQSVRRNSFENRMMFLFSAESFRQMYRRLRYLQEYSDFQAQQGKAIQQKQAELEQKEDTLRQMRAEKQQLLAQQQTEQQALASQQAEHQALVKKLQKKQADIRAEIKKQQSERDRLDKKIDQLINEQIAASRKKKSAGKTDSKSSGGYKMSPEDVKLSGSFENNRGRLPVPVVGPYMLASHYGINAVDGMKDVKVNNLGVDVKCNAGATVRSIYEGEVSTVFEHPSRKTYGVLVRHGNYISVYCNLATISIKQGDKVKAGATLGTVHADPNGECILQFQLRRDLQRLNPEEWIRF